MTFNKYIYSIDYLRGFMALLIMIYHYSSWSHFIEFNASHILTRVALYGVSIFFIISGFSLTLVYYNKFKTITFRALLIYIQKRFARIYPLFWFVVIFSILIGYKQLPNIDNLVVQLTITFQLFNGYSGFTPGAWSIGIEIIFYLLLPFILYFINKMPKYSMIILSLLLLSTLYYSSFHLHINNTNSEYFQKNYFHDYAYGFFNHFYFFIFGILIGLLYIKKNKLFKVNIYLLSFFILITIFIFIFYPIQGASGYLIYETNRVIFTLLSFLIFILFVSYSLYNNNKINILKKLGDISYTIYLTHPITYFILQKYFFDILGIHKPLIQIIISILLAILFSLLIYKLYEIPAKRKLLGENLVQQ